MVARALAQNAPLIIMDEPTAHLDYRHELIIMETIAELTKQTGLSVLMATHIPNHCFYFENQGITTRAALIKEQRIIAMGKPSQVLTEKNLNELYSIHTRILDYQMDDGGYLKQVLPISTIKP
jgi:iron complex transport system ATP-binding protein